ncbi:MAG TPA: hypothetical protein VIS96_18640 [Terrimicrobiaceae bacterium]
MGKKPSKKTAKKPSLTGVKKATGVAAVKCKNPPLKTGTLGTYGDLLKQKGTGTSDRDHMPSYKALEKRAEKLAKRKLTSAEKGRVKRAGKAIVLPKAQHKRGRTFGGKNTDVQSSSDATDLAAAVKKDIQAYKDDGVSGPLLKTMNTMKMTNKQYDTLLLGAVKGQ